MWAIIVKLFEECQLLSFYNPFHRRFKLNRIQTVYLPLADQRYPLHGWGAHLLGGRQTNIFQYFLKN